MCLIQIKHAQIKFPLFGFWTVQVCVGLIMLAACLLLSFLLITSGV
jgi:hypothetical protein